MKIKNAEGKVVEVDIFFEKKSTKGRPQKVLTDDAIKLIENLSGIMCTEEEIAFCLGTCPETLNSPANKDVYREALKRGKAQGKQSLRRYQWECAKKGNSSMLIWLGKQYLGQTEKFDAVIQNNNADIVNKYLEVIKNGKK